VVKQKAEKSDLTLIKWLMVQKMSENLPRKWGRN